jgi:hypothetical protein
MILLIAVGFPFVLRRFGLSGAAGFLLGAAAAWLNLRLIERGVDRIVHLVAAEPEKRRGGRGVWIFVQFAGFGALAFVILRFTDFSLVAALFGFLVCPAAAILEIVYELITYGHS